MFRVQTSDNFTKPGKAYHDAAAFFWKCQAYKILPIYPSPQVIDIIDGVLFSHLLFCLSFFWRKRKTVLYLQLDVCEVWQIVRQHFLCPFVISIAKVEVNNLPRKPQEVFNLPLTFSNTLKHIYCGK